MSILLCYVQLCAGDYKWWWKSFIAAGATSIYVFCYSFIYFSYLESNMFITYVLYFSYMLLVSFGIFLVTGTVGVLSSFYFIYHIYGSIKVD